MGKRTQESGAEKSEERENKVTWHELNQLVAKRSNQAHMMNKKADTLRGKKKNELKDNALFLHGACEYAREVLGERGLTDLEREERIKATFMRVIGENGFSFEGC